LLVEIYGPPELYGFETYRIIESRETSWPKVYGYVEENEARSRCRPIHRYNRVERFKNTLDNLLGCRGCVSDDVMKLMHGVKGEWNAIRAILKNNRVTRMYNQIPLILRKLGFGNCIEFENFNESYKAILLDFKGIHHRFDLKRDGMKKYFPNLRFVALTLIKKWGGHFKIDIPFIRTKRKLAPLIKVINEFSN